MDDAERGGSELEEVEHRGPATRLLVVSHECSPAQAEYQKLRVNPGSMSNLFYKDATPRGEHYMQCVVKLLGREHESEAQRRVVPLKLTLCYDDGQPIEAVDHSSLRILSSNSHLKAAIPANEDHVTFSYRIELGSFRRADRSFAVRVEADADATHRPSSYLALSKCREIEPCLTPAVYVLSKKKLNDPSPQGMQLGGLPVPARSGGISASPFAPATLPRPDFGPATNGYPALPKRKFVGEDYDDGGPEQIRLRWSGTGTHAEPDDTSAIMVRLTAIESQVSQLASVINKFTGTFEQIAQQPTILPPASAAEPADPNGQRYYTQSPRSVYNVTRILPPFADDPVHQQQGSSPHAQQHAGVQPPQQRHRASPANIGC